MYLWDWWDAAYSIHISDLPSLLIPMSSALPCSTVACQTSSWGTFLNSRSRLLLDDTAGCVITFTCISHKLLCVDSCISIEWRQGWGGLKQVVSSFRYFSCPWIGQVFNRRWEFILWPTYMLLIVVSADLAFIIISLAIREIKGVSYSSWPTSRYANQSLPQSRQYPNIKFNNTYMQKFAWTMERQLGVRLKTRHCIIITWSTTKTIISTSYKLLCWSLTDTYGNAVALGWIICMPDGHLPCGTGPEGAVQYVAIWSLTPKQTVRVTKLMPSADGNFLLLVTTFVVHFCWCVGLHTSTQWSKVKVYQRGAEVLRTQHNDI